MLYAVIGMLYCLPAKFQDRQTDRYADRQTDRQTAVRAHGRTCGRTDRHPSGRTDGHTYGHTDRRNFFLLVLSSKTYKTWTFIKRRGFFFHSCDYNSFFLYILRLWWESKNDTDKRKMRMQKCKLQTKSTLFLYILTNRREL